MRSRGRFLQRRPGRRSRVPPACDFRSGRRCRISGGARARRPPVRERGTLGVPRVVRPVLGTREVDHTSGARKPRVRDRGRGRLLPSTSVPPRAPGQKGYYSFDLGGWHLIALNSNCSRGRRLRRRLRAGAVAAGRPCRQPCACTLAYWHHPRFSSGEHGNDSTYGRSGRRSTSERGHGPGRARSPLRALRAADPGRRSRSRARHPRVRRRHRGARACARSPTVRPNSRGARHTSFGILELTLRARSYAWRFRPAVGSFRDSGTASCH